MDPTIVLPTVKPDRVRGKVDFAILTIRQDEEAAVHERFPPVAVVDTAGEAGAAWPYAIAYPKVQDGWYAVAIVRCLHQGTNQAQRVAADAIRDLQPRWLLTVGIAGGVAHDEFTLGDVVLSSFVYDLTVTAAQPDGSEEYSVTGGFMPRAVEQFLAGLGARRKQFDGWNAAEAINSPRPPVDPQGDRCAGDEEYQRKLRRSLMAHFGEHPRAKPLYKTGPIISSNRLVKDPDLVRHWRTFARHAVAMEMEFAASTRPPAGGARVAATCPCSPSAGSATSSGCNAIRGGPPTPATRLRRSQRR